MITRQRVAMKTPQHFTISSRNEYEFSSSAIEIVIFDGRGRVVWRKRRDQAITPIRWEGLDLDGMPIEVGSYTCKIIYADQQEIYLPFVFVR